MCFEYRKIKFRVVPGTGRIGHGILHVKSSGNETLPILDFPVTKSDRSNTLRKFFVLTFFQLQNLCQIPSASEHEDHFVAMNYASKKKKEEDSTRAYERRIVIR